MSGLTSRDAWRALTALQDGGPRREAALRLLESLPPGQRLPWLDRVMEEGRSPGGNPAAIALAYGTMNDLLTAFVSTGPERPLNATGSMEHDCAGMVAAKWAELDPPAARAWFKDWIAAASGSIPEGGARAASAMAAAMAGQNPEEAFLWAAGLPEEQTERAREAAIREVLYEVMRTGPPEAARLLSLHTSIIPDAEGLADFTAKRFAEWDPRGALLWAAGTDKSIRRKAIAGALRYRVKDEGYDAVFREVRDLGGEAAADGLSVILNDAPPERLSEAAALLETLPEGEARAHAGGVLTGWWVDENPEAAGEWMKRQPPGLVRDEAVSAYALWASGEDPGAALAWAETVSEPQRREETLEGIIRRLGPKAAEAVEPWLASHPSLPEEERERIREKVRLEAEDPTGKIRAERRLREMVETLHSTMPKRSGE